MGSSTTKASTVLQYDPTEWRNIGIHRQNIQILQNLRLISQAQQGQMQNIPFNEKLDIEKQLQIYQYRKDQQNNALVGCHCVNIKQQKKKPLCGQNRTLQVITERISHRFSQIKDLTFPESLYSLSQCFKGYQDCYKKLGPFQITQNMIGTNKKGQVKVWVNQFFAFNHSNQQKPILQLAGSNQYELVKNLQAKKDQNQMVQSIVKIIEKKCANGSFPQQFKQRINKKGLKFDQAFKEIQKYSKDKHIFVPDRLIKYVKVGKKQTVVTNVVNNYQQNLNKPFIYQQVPITNQNPTIKIQKSSLVYNNPQLTFIPPTNNINSTYEPKYNLVNSTYVPLAPARQVIRSNIKNTKVRFNFVSPEKIVY